MYGTIAQFRIKPGMEAELQANMKAYEALGIPGFVSSTVYKMDADSNEYYMAVAFESKELYFQNAQDPAQDARYREMLSFMEGEPEWHDGEIVYRL
jgi:hypothetical protein